EHPSVEVPVGDFFGIGNGVFKDFISLPLQMSPQDGRGMNCWFPMPFDSARITLESECENRINVYFYIDYEEYSLPHGPDIARFHAQWRREAVTEGWLTERLDSENLWDIWSRKPNITGEDNYVILEAEGSGIYVGCNLNVDVFERQANDWYGEGDDMIFVDGEAWPPALHGTGTEDYFNMAFCPRTEYCAPYHGLTLYSGNSEWPWSGKNSMYRYHIEDPVRFNKSIKVSIEHGHANKLSNDYSSTAYWYQLEPHSKFPQLLPVGARMARIDPE
ncbi:MAG: glycoside hydrolase family 172 protein, partial [Fimbriimonadaceae bacterium]